MIKEPLTVYVIWSEWHFSLVEIISRTMKAILFLLGLSILPQFHDCHVSLTFPPARNYPLDFLDSARTKAPCGMPKGCRTYILIIWLIQYPSEWNYYAMQWCNDLVARLWLTKPLRFHVGLCHTLSVWLGRNTWFSGHFHLYLTYHDFTSLQASNRHWLLYFLNMSASHLNPHTNTNNMLKSTVIVVIDRPAL